MIKTAVIIGVGPIEGLGSYLGVKAAEEGLHVIVSGRTQTSLDAVVEIISLSGGTATGIVADATDQSSVNTLIKKAEAIGPIDLAIYNTGDNFPGNFLTMDAKYFENACESAHWEASCLPKQR
jgi:NAD(P)-dependent dehydrogenase (short-subunit alcohol dehydrogenase family)